MPPPEPRPLTSNLVVTLVDVEGITVDTDDADQFWVDVTATAGIVHDLGTSLHHPDLPPVRLTFGPLPDEESARAVGDTCIEFLGMGGRG